MPFTSYPSAGHIEAALKSGSYWPVASTQQELARFQAGIVAEAVADEWERLVGWGPFLAEAGSSTRTFTTLDSRGELDFQGAAQSVSSVQIGEGAPLVISQSVWMLPENATAQGYIGGLKFGYGNGVSSNGLSLGSPITVTAVWGRVTNVPGDVFLALLKRAQSVMMDQIENLQSVASISQDGFNKSYDIVGVRTQKDIAETGDKDFLKIAQRWARVVR